MVLSVRQRACVVAISTPFSLEVHLAPGGLGVRVQDAHDLANRAEGILAQKRGLADPHRSHERANRGFQECYGL